MMFLSGFLVYLFLTSSTAWIEATRTELLNGESMAVEEETQFLSSPDATFSSGFYPVGNNSYCYSIWFAKSSDKTVVWMANRDKPVNGRQSKLTLTKGGNLVLTDADGSITWSTDTTTDEQVQLRLLDTGNLVLANQTGSVMWQSFDFPTDTLLPEQQFLKDSTLISIRSPGTYLSGFYYLKFNDDNILNLIYNGPSLSSIYWPDPGLKVFENGRSRYNSSRVAVLTKIGRFESSDNLNFNASDYGIGPMRRLTIDYDGILRMYSLDKSSGNWTISWFAGGRLDACLVNGLCGDYGICSYNPIPTCICPPGFIRNDPSDWTRGCKPSFNLTCNSEDFDYIPLPYTDYYGYDLENVATIISFETCKNSCFSNCQCIGFGYSMDGWGRCFPKGVLRNGYTKPDSAMAMYLKAPKGTVTTQMQDKLKEQNPIALKCSASELILNPQDHVATTNKFRYLRLLIAFVISVGVIELIFICFGWWNIFRKHVNEEFVHMGYIVLAMGFNKFSYAELKRATKNFKQEIGKGGFGTVYRGVLDDGRVVAVKRLEGILQGDAEFWAEVSIIGKINHRNLVRLWGFCAEKHHKMLVYEYIENGSLDKFLSSDSSQVLDFDQRYEIAVGTAKGLSYLHEECLEWVLHCDIKPQNILLNEVLEPKVSDFGLAKLFRDINENGFSKVRGTRGYLAPEWMMNGKIDAKADVYSYGIVLLELISGKNAYCFQSWSIAEDNKNTDLVNWMIKNVEEGEIEKVIDPRLIMEECEQSKIETLLKVAFLCVREDRDKRPTMSRVVELLTSYEEPTSI